MAAELKVVWVVETDGPSPCPIAVFTSERMAERMANALRRENKSTLGALWRDERDGPKFTVHTVPLVDIADIAFVETVASVRRAIKLGGGKL